MLDKVRISVIIEDINKYFKEIQEMKIRDIKDLNTIKFRAVSMDIFSIINKTIDLAEEVASKTSFGFPSEYRELFTILKQAKIIDEKIEEKMKDLIILRNKIAHRYGVITKEDILKALKKINIIKDFIKKIKEVKEEKK